MIGQRNKLRLRSVKLWAQSQDEEPIQYDGIETKAQMERTDDDEIAIHVFPPGDSSGADVTIYMTVAEAEGLGLDLIREAGL